MIAAYLHVDILPMDGANILQLVILRSTIPTQYFYLAHSRTLDYIRLELKKMALVMHCNLKATSLSSILRLVRTQLIHKSVTVLFHAHIIKLLLKEPVSFVNKLSS